MASPVSPESLLAALLPHLNAQTTLLPTLHHQLGLPPSALQTDFETLRIALRNAVDSAVETRRGELAQWTSRCETLETSCQKLARAVGENTKGTGLSVGELRKQKVLPKRFEALSALDEKLAQMYQTKLEQLQTLTNRIMTLCATLGQDFYTPDILHPTPASGAAEPLDEARRDVTPERFTRLERELARGKTEITRRLVNLSQTLEHIVWLYDELGVPLPSLTTPSITPMFTRSTSSSTHVSPDPFAMPLPPREYSREENEANTLTLARFIARISEAEGEDLEGDMLGVEGVDPTVQVIEWFDDLRAQCEDEKQRRENRIQVMYDQLEVLWKRLGIEDAIIDDFVENNRGSTESTLAAYERELERMLELKRESMSLFIGNARAEIQSLWDDLMLGSEERESFLPYTDDEHTEELLTVHEEEIQCLRQERKSKAQLLVAIRKYYAICKDQEELEASATDQSRLLGRGPRDPGRLLREEKMRKRVTKEKPKLMQEMITSIPVWEEENGVAFLVNGVRMADVLRETLEAEDASRGDRKRPRPASAAPIRNAPAGTTTTVPLRSANAPSTARSVTPTARSAATPTPSQSQPATKRQRVNSVHSSRPPVTATTRVAATPSARLGARTPSIASTATATSSRSTATSSRSGGSGHGRTPSESSSGSGSGRGALRTIPYNTPQSASTPALHKSTTRTQSAIPLPASRARAALSSSVVGNPLSKSLSRSQAPPALSKSQAQPMQVDSRISTTSSTSSTHALFGGSGSSQNHLPPRANPAADTKRRGLRRESFKPRASIETDEWANATGQLKGWIKSERLEEEDY